MGNCCCGPIPTESCGWPKGTVRALISIIIILLTFVIASASVIILILRGEILYAIGILSTIFSIISAVIAFYFGTKSGESATKAVVESNEKLLAEKDKEMNILMNQNIYLERELDNEMVRVNLNSREMGRQRYVRKSRGSGIVLPDPNIISDLSNDTVIDIEEEEEEEDNSVTDM